ncbi:hypothetical protein BC936DRAFT_147556 [Jimgerdemannia flammicorona]|uniref:Uncharacterized protein n=1 Tax=Jimgerdemannia flammicorona TaxID=994334 RepID=A0A433D519_9FUNG|nr:hypothetical protein BC936DRAFT_147556 [Jimgerdemannia flammicorona]
MMIRSPFTVGFSELESSILSIHHYASYHCCRHHRRLRRRIPSRTAATQNRFGSAIPIFKASGLPGNDYINNGKWATGFCNWGTRCLIVVAGKSVNSDEQSAVD